MAQRRSYASFIFSLIICAYFVQCLFTYKEWHFIDSVNLIFHEAGHTIFFFFGEFTSVAAGSGFQVLLPLLCVAYFFLKQQNISGSLCMLWLGQSLVNVSVYAGDAQAMALPLLGGDSVSHDWNYLLSSLNLLQSTSLVASTIYGIGAFAIVAGCVLALYFSWLKTRDNLAS